MSQNDSRTTEYKVQLDYALREMLSSQVDVDSERSSYGAVSEDTHAEFERTVMTMRRRLLPYAEEPVVRKIWESENLDLIPYYCHRTHVTEGTRGHYGIKGKDKTVVEHAAIEKLDRWCDVMVQICSKLGFTPEPEDIQQEARGEYTDIFENAPDSD